MIMLEGIDYVMRLYVFFFFFFGSSTKMHGTKVLVPKYTVYYDDSFYALGLG